MALATWEGTRADEPRQDNQRKEATGVHPRFESERKSKGDVVATAPLCLLFVLYLRGLFETATGIVDACYFLLAHMLYNRISLHSLIRTYIYIVRLLLLR